jgi:hypothetical protein
MSTTSETPFTAADNVVHRLGTISSKESRNMNQPTVRISLSARGRRQLLPGLEHILNGIGSFRYFGSTPNANPWEMIDFQRAAVHEDRAFNVQLADQVLHLRNQVRWRNKSGKFRFTTIDLSLLALALRVSRRLGKAPYSVSSPLEAKLEKFRKRAKRAAIARLGNQEYKESTLRWRHFLSWMRFYLLCFRWPYRRGTDKLTWRYQREQLVVLIKKAISEISDVEVPDPTVIRLAALLKAELRRDRHEVTLTEMMRGGPDGMQVLRNFLLKRLDLYPLKPQAGPFYMRLADPPKLVPLVAALPQDQHHEDKAQSKPNGAVMAAPVPVVEPVHRRRLASLTDAEAERCLVPWWREAVPSRYRSDVWEEAKKQLMWQWPSFVVRTTARTTEELFQQTEPSYTPEIAPEVINFLVQWLLGWCLALTRDWRRVFNLMGRSYLLAENKVACTGSKAQNIRLI